MCVMNEYMLFCFSSVPDFGERENDDRETFTAWWVKQVSARFGIAEEVLEEIYDKDEKHETSKRVDDIFWYGDALEFEHLPALLINGELQHGFPESEQEWLDVIATGWSDKKSDFDDGSEE